jgi:trimethylamine---corrinoid protein Co-methyltransferase
MSEMKLSVLSQEEIERIHRKTLLVLERTGARIPHPETLRRCRRMGATVDEATDTVRFPKELVEELRAAAPAIATETGLDGTVREVGKGNRYYMSLVVDPWIVDYEGGLRRPVLEDVRRNTIVGESLPNVAALMRMQYPVQDVLGTDSYYKTMEVFLSHTTKHIAAYPSSIENARDWMDVTEVIAETAGVPVKTTPLLSLAVAVTSPLQVYPLNMEIIAMATERCYPVIPTVCPMAGTTSPYSVAGTSLLANAETLLVTILTQLYSPGHPVFHAVGPSSTNLQTGEDLYYRAEKALFKAAGNQMGMYYGLPIAGEAGGTLTWRPDVQNGAEGMLYLLSSATTGQNMIGGLGSLHNANGMSSEQIVIQSGLAAMAEYVAAGIDTSGKLLAEDSIDAVGPGGNYMAEELTLQLLRNDTEFFRNLFFDMSGGYTGASPGMYEIAHHKVEDLVCGYTPTVPESVRGAIKDFFRSKYADPHVADL